MTPELTDLSGWERQQKNWAGVTDMEVVTRYLEMNEETASQVRAIIEQRLSSRIYVCLKKRIRSSYPNGGEDIARKASANLWKSLEARRPDAYGLQKAFYSTIYRRAQDAVRIHLKDRLVPTDDVEPVAQSAAIGGLPDRHLSTLFLMSLSKLLDGRDPARRKAFEMTVMGETQERIAAEVGRSSRTISAWQANDRVWIETLREKGYI